MALTDTDLQLVVEHVRSMLPAMLTGAAPDYNGTQKLISRIEQNLVRVEEHLARSEERSAQEFKALRELMQAGFAAVDKRFQDMQAYMDKRFEDMNKRFEDMNKRFEDLQSYVDKRFEDMNKRFTSLQWMGTVAFVVLGAVITVVGLAG